MADDETCYIYLIVHKGANGVIEGPVKVGITKTLDGRLAQIQTGNPRQLDIALYMPLPNREIAATFERAFHEVKANKRMAGEWFDMSPYEGLVCLCANVRGGLKHFLGEDQELLNDAMVACRLLEAEDWIKQIDALHRPPETTVQ